LQHSPFEILYGQQPTQFGIDPDQDCVILDLADWLKNRKLVTSLIQQQLLRAQQRMKHQADKHRTERSFQVGDRVWLKLQPYVQSSMTSRVSPKLSYHYFGPFEVEARIGSAAYRLKLLPTSSIHNVFHVLKLVKELVLDRRATTRNNRLYHQLLVKWRDLPLELATWEAEDELLRRYPNFTAWGQAVANGGGNVTVRFVDGSSTAKKPKEKRSRKHNSKYNGSEWGK
jgi:hypothetical protein